MRPRSVHVRAFPPCSGAGSPPHTSSVTSDVEASCAPSSTAGISSTAGTGVASSEPVEVSVSEPVVDEAEPVEGEEELGLPVLVGVPAPPHVLLAFVGLYLVLSAPVFPVFEVSFVFEESSEGAGDDGSE